MPTGYTWKLAEKGQSFRDFALDCARAFGALITMRDEPKSTPIPKTLKPRTDYYDKELLKSKVELRSLLAMNNKEKLEYGKKKKQEKINHFQECLAKTKLQNKRLRDMESKVQRWSPPTPDHDKFKEFMLQQINVSIRDTYFEEKTIEQASKEGPLEYYAKAVIEAKQSIEYFEEARAKELARTYENNEWIEQLRESL